MLRCTPDYTLLIDNIINCVIQEKFYVGRKSSLNEVEDLSDSLVSGNDMFIERITAMMDQAEAQASRKHGRHVENKEE